MIEFVSCQISGDISNQLFQIASVIEYGKKFDKRIIFPEDIFKNTSLIELKNNPMIFQSKDFDKIDFRLYDINEMFPNAKELKGDIFFEGSHISFRNISNKTKLSLSNMICENEEKITKSYEMYVLINQHFNKEDDLKYISVHVNRVNSESKINLDYYQTVCNTLNHFEKKLRNLVIFSNDIQWSKENFKLNGYDSSNMYFVDMDDSYAELLLMSYYKDNILSLSQCSWWGSFLGNDKNKKVFCPYIKDNENVYDSSWIVV